MAFFKDVPDLTAVPHTGGPVGCALGCHSGGREFVSSTPAEPTLRVLEITEEKVLAL